MRGECTSRGNFNHLTAPSSIVLVNRYNVRTKNMKKRKATRLEQGIILAASFVANEHGQGTIAREIFQLAGAREIDPMSVDENDRAALLEYQKDEETRDGLIERMCAKRS